MKGIIATDSAANAGAIVYWTCADSAQEPLIQAFTAAGLDPSVLPAVRRPLICLRDAVASTVRAHGIRGGKFQGATPDLAAEFSVDVRDLARGTGCVAVIDRATLQDSDKDRTIVRVAFGNSPSHADQLVISGEIPPDEIRAAYSLARATIHHGSLSNMLATRIMCALDGISLRESGGVYYVPPASVARLQAYAQALACVGSQVFTIPAMQSESAVAAILAAVTRDAEILADTMTEELIESDLGAKALQGRARTADLALQKLERYETLLGQSLSDIRDRISGLSVNFGEAAIVALASIGNE